MTATHYENLLIGSGEANKYLAWALAKEGHSTALIERALIGGSCPNIACLPSKNVIHSAKVASLVKRAAEFGIRTGPIAIDMAAVIARKRGMVDGLISLHRQKFHDSGAELIMGQARFTAPRTVQVELASGGTQTITGERLFLSVGTHASIPGIPGLAESRPMSHVEALELERRPERLVVLGGGHVGLEFAQAMRRLGSQVMLVHRGPQLLREEDPEVSDAVRALLERDGVSVLLESQFTRVQGKSGDLVQLELQQGGQSRRLEATDLLVALGRTPNTARLGAAEAGIELDHAGHIRVNERLETTAPNVWALGECAGTPKFTHAAFDDYRVVHANLTGGRRTTRDRLIPYCLFTDPELARIGLTEREARRRGIPFRIASMPIGAVLRTWTISEREGLLKALVGANDRLLGFTALGAEASELLAAVQTAMLGGLPYQSLRDALFAHPTISEGLGALFTTLSSPN